MHPLAQHALPGLDARRLRQLEAAGLSHLEDLVRVGADELMAVTEFDAKTCRALVRLAEGALGRDASVIPLQNQGGNNSRLGRGLNAARRIEKTHAVLRKVSSILPVAPVKRRWQKSLRRLRKQLVRCEERLTTLQQSLLAEGVSAAGDAHLREILEDVERRIEHQLERRMCRRLLRDLTRTVREGRKNLGV